MLGRCCIVRHTSGQIAGAAETAIKAHWKERIKGGPRISDRFLAASEDVMKAYADRGVMCTSMTLQSGKDSVILYVTQVAVSRAEMAE